MDYLFIDADYLDEIVSYVSHCGNTTLAGDVEVTTSDVIEYELRSNAFKQHSASEVGANGLTRPGSDSPEAFILLMDVYEKIDDLSENPFDALEGQVEIIWNEDALKIYKAYPDEIEDYFSARVDSDRYDSISDALHDITGGDSSKIDSALYEPIEGLGGFDRLIVAIGFCVNVFAEQIAADTFESAIHYVADRLEELTESD